MKRIFFTGFLCGIAACAIFSVGYLTAQPAQAPSQITGCIYSSSTVTLTNMQTSALLCDVNGRLKVTTSP